MDIKDILLDMKKAYRKKDFIAITEDNYEIIKEQTELQMCFMDLMNVLKENKLELDNLYYVERTLSPFCYHEGLMFIDLSANFDEVIKEHHYKEKIDNMNQMFSELIRSKDFDSLLNYIDPKYKFWTFLELLPKIPEEMIYKVFKKVYIQGYCRFDSSDWEQARRILESNKDRTSVEPLKTDDKGYVSIFRGVGSKSTPLDKTFSWTISFDIAIRFAKMYDLYIGKVYKGKVKKEDIIDFYQERDEEEVLIFPEKVVDIEDMGLLNFDKQFAEELNHAGVVTEYNKIAQFILPQLFTKPEGIHGVLHAKRVLLLTLIQSYILKLPNEQRQLLAMCAVFHDIGRKNDDKDSKHGIFSIQKLKDNELIEALTKRIGKEGISIFNFIAENHPISDAQGIKRINNYGIQDVKIAKKLYLLFKDADGLDRCRLDDFNVKYLRNDVSKKLVLVAGQLLRGIK